jgi:hypothetical protein
VPDYLTAFHQTPKSAPPSDRADYSPSAARLVQGLALAYCQYERSAVAEGGNTPVMLMARQTAVYDLLRKQPGIATHTTHHEQTQRADRKRDNLTTAQDSTGQDRTV